MTDSTESYEEHVLQNNNRLLSIAQSLRELSTFSSACTELTQWCSDPRAYTAHFEQNLLTALQICVENGTKEGYDFAIAHQLITCCFQHRKMLSKESAVRINRWYEQYRRIKKNGGKRKRKTEVAPVDPAAFEQITVTDSGCTSSMWPQGGPMAGATPLQSPSYQPMMPMHGAYPGMQPSPFPPMDPTGARQGYPGDPNGYDPQTAMQIQQQRQMMAMQQHQMAMAQHQHRRRAQAQAQGMAPGFDQAMYNGIPMGANSVPGQSQPLLRMPSQTAMTSPAYPGMMAGRQGVQQPMTTPAYPQGNPQMIRAGPPILFGQMQNTAQHQQVMSYPNPHAPNGAMLPAAEAQQILMIPQGVPLLNLFTISPENPTFSTTFEISPELYQQLGSVPYYHLQLKSTKDSGTTMRTSWPTNENGELAIQVAVNGQTLPLNKDKSFFIKPLMKMGQNTLEIAPTQAAMRHFYMIQVVTVVPAGKVIEEIFTRQRMKQFPPEFSKQKLMQRAVANGGSVSVSLMDPKFGGKLKIPARSTKCQHTACFDLNTTLMEHFECARLMCPVMGCSTIFAIDEVEVDEFVLSVLRESAHRNPAATELTLDASGIYRLVDGAEPSTSRKRTADDSSSFTMKRIKSEQFPMPPTSSSPFPTISSLPAQISQSPMMSPFPAHISPKKEVLSPAAAKINGGPVTPAGLDPPVATTSGPQLSSPHHQPIQQHGSVEAPSLTGSAPYTPASMNGPHPHQPDPSFTQHNNSFSSLDIDDLLHTNMSVDDFQRYLLDNDNCCARESRVGDDLWSEQTLQDIREVISADLGKA